MVSTAVITIVGSVSLHSISSSLKCGDEDEESATERLFSSPLSHSNESFSSSPPLVAGLSMIISVPTTVRSSSPTSSLGSIDSVLPSEHPISPPV